MKIEINSSNLWKLLPGKYRYIAQDKSGSWYAYKEKPDMGENEWTLNNKPLWSSYYNYKLITDTGIENPDWRKTLQQRPKNQAQ